MTGQLTMEGFAEIGRIVPTDLNGEMQRSYLEYAMSVIVGRALPDVRDGLKPVHRRILYAMHELGLTPDRPFRKCARVVGDVLGKYHPHGDQAVYDALVRMVQSFSSRYPLISGHGNFGSVDNDPPAAMRYTECRLAPVSQEGMLSEISEDIVEFTPNFDGSQAEPAILPTRLPMLLLNGSSGIAVGMATNIPPHNLGELVDGLLLLIDRPQATVEDLLKKIPAPDFPTGGQIVGTSGIKDAYTQGRGSITVRGVTTVEEIQGTKGRHRRTAIVITEFPYQVNKAAWIEKVADLVNQGRIQDISDLRDESDRTGIRVVVELRRDANPQKVLNQLFKLTPLQTNFGAILLALVEGEPKQLGLKDLLHQFLDFREQTLTRLFRSELTRVSRKAEEVAGMLLALEQLDGVIDLLRTSADGTTAKVRLQETLGCNAAQADTILSMPLRRLTGLEQEKLQQEQETLLARIAELEGLLQDRHKLLNYLKKELRSLKRSFGDERRTEIKTQAEIEEEEAQEQEVLSGEEESYLVQFTQKGYVRRLAVPSRRTRRSLREIPGDDLVLQTHLASLSHEILVLTASGRAYTVKVGEIPLTSNQGRGTPLVTLVSNDETLKTFFILDPSEPVGDLILLSRQGRLKRIGVGEFVNLTSRGSTLMKLKEGDELGWADLYLEHQHPQASLIVATSGGRTLRLRIDENQIPVMGKTAMGNQALRLHRKESIAGMAVVPQQETVVLATEQGYFKRVQDQDLPRSERGGIGIQAMTFKRKSDSIAGVLSAAPDHEIWVNSSQGQPQILALETIPLEDRAGSGSQLIKPEVGEKISGLLVSLHEIPELGG